jgi:hypothetical protein
MLKQNLSLTNLLTRLINSPTPPSKAAPEGEQALPVPSDKKMNTTVRLDPTLKAFIDAEAEKLGISLQEFIAMCLKAIMTDTLSPPAGSVNLMLARFFEVFEIHGVGATDIHHLVPGLNRSDLLEARGLADRLTDEMFEAVADLFMVELEWLKGHGHQPYGYSMHNWYKNLDGFAARLAYLQWHSTHTRVYFCVKEGTSYEALLAAKEEGDRIEPLQMSVVIECERLINKVRCRVYDVWEAQRWNYGPCRLHLKAMMHLCEKARVSYDGIQVPQAEFTSLCNGSLLAAHVFRARAVWYPDQFFWTDERNLERDEIKAVKAFFKEKLPTFANAMRALENPLSVTNWDTCLRKGFIFKDPVKAD